MTGELPKGWRLVKVREAGAVQLGRQRSPDVHRGANMRPYLRVANVFEDRIDLRDVMEMHFESREVERYELKVGDILLNEGQSRELVGRPAMYRGELPGGCFTNSLVRFQASEAVERRYALELFRHWLKSGAFQQIAQITTNIAHLGAGRFADMDFPLPPLNEQRRIVAKLEALQARSRRAREALDAAPPLLEKLRQSILAAAFRGDLTKDWRAKNKDIEPATKLLERIRAERRKKWEESELAKMKAKGKPPTDDKWKAKYKEPLPIDGESLPELPERWCWATLGELAWDAGYGTSAKCDYGAEGVAVLRIPNISRGTLNLAGMKHAVTAVDDPTMLIEPGDMLIVRTNGSRDLIGRAAVVAEPTPEPTSFASYLIRFRVVGLVTLPLWIGRYWQSPAVRRLIEGHAASSAGQYNVSLGELATCPVPLAPPGEQEQILRILDAGLGGHLTSEHHVETLRANLVALDRAVLAKAFRGELVPQDPNDEPADAMLARARTSNGADAATNGTARTRTLAPKRPAKRARSTQAT